VWILHHFFLYGKSKGGLTPLFSFAFAFFFALLSLIKSLIFAIIK